jgi:hypothetical protein
MRSMRSMRSMRLEKSVRNSKNPNKLSLIISLLHNILMHVPVDVLFGLL